MVAKAEQDVFDRLLEQWDDFDADTARKLLRIKFSKIDINRVNKLSAKAREATLTPEEESELDMYLNLSRTIAILQSKARTRLKHQQSLSR
jgi:hypothetical protein